MGLLVLVNHPFWSLTKGGGGLTDADTDVRASKVAVSLGDGAHANLVVAAREEGSEGAHEGDCALPGGTADTHTNEVLLRDEAFDELFWFRVAQEDGEGGVLGVSVQTNHARVCSAQTLESATVRLAGRHL